MDLHVLERHCLIGKTALETELAVLHKAMDTEMELIEKETAGKNQYEKDNYVGGYLSEVNDEYIMVSETLPRLQWYSQFLLGYAFFEKSLNDICSLIRDERKYQLSFKDLGDQGTTRARNYLVKVAGIAMPFNTNEWQTVKMFGEIRNIIAHRNGFVDYLPDQISSPYMRLGQMQGIELRTEYADQKDAQIFFDSSFVVNALSIYRTILRMIGTQP